MILPSGLDHLRGTTQGRKWLDSLPEVVAASAAKWGLTLGAPYQDSYVSLVCPARTGGGTSAVLKVQFPDPESQHEGLALRLWDGDGAVRLIDEDRELRALLIERCEPGHHLSTAGATVALDVLVDLVPRLWLAPGPEFGTLSDEVSRWVGNLPDAYVQAGAPFEESLLTTAIETLEWLAATQGEQVLVHQDLHGDNVLSARREPWLVIDPKPLAGEREFGLSPIIRSAELGHSKEHVMYRLDLLSGALGLDRDRARMWAGGQALAWAFEDGAALPGHLEMARWRLAG